MTTLADLDIPLAVSAEKSSITVDRGGQRVEPQRLTVHFNRTVRVSDNNGVSTLPPGLGYFPVYKTRDYKDGLLEWMAAKGGFFIPMYQREAMWLSFTSGTPFAVKIYVGSVNVVSGEPVLETQATMMRRLRLLDDHKSIQDYVVSPKQLWLDGIASADGTVRQFVAVPLGSGYSIEAQISGDDLVGGLQFEVTPSVVVPILPKPHLRRRRADDPSFDVFVMTLTGAFLIINVTAEATIDDMKHAIQDQKGIPPDEQRLIGWGKQLEDGRTMSAYGIKAGDTLHLVSRFRGGGGSLPFRQVDMGIAAGGKIKQTIIADPFPTNIWDGKHTIIFNVQILNSALFEQVTGTPPPITPVTAADYAEAGLPYYDIYYEKPSAIMGDFKDVKSVNTLDKGAQKSATTAKAIKEVEQSTANPVIQLSSNGQCVAKFRPASELEALVRAMRDKA